MILIAETVSDLNINPISCCCTVLQVCIPELWMIEPKWWPCKQGNEHLIYLISCFTCLTRSRNRKSLFGKTADKESVQREEKNRLFYFLLPDFKLCSFNLTDWKRFIWISNILGSRWVDSKTNKNELIWKYFMEICSECKSWSRCVDWSFLTVSNIIINTAVSGKRINLLSEPSNPDRCVKVLASPCCCMQDEFICAGI